MANWKEHFTMSRHERVGALVVMAFIAVTLLLLWVSSQSAPSSDDGNHEVIEQFTAQVDSVRRGQAQADSARLAHKQHRKHSKRDTTEGRHKRKGGKHHAPTRKAPAPSRPLEPVPNY